MSTPKANNVILFPGVKSVTYPANLDTEQIIAELAGDFCEYVTRNKTNPLSIAEHEFDLALLLESMRSVLNKIDGKPHPFQEVSKSLFEKSDKGSITIKVK